MNQDILELKLRGLCCSQIMMELGLRKLEKENPDLIAAMAALCNGLWQGKTCGILSAALCLLYVADPEAAGDHGEVLREWFEDSFESQDCDALLENNPMNKVEKCPMMLDATFLKVCELLDWE